MTTQPTALRLAAVLEDDESARLHLLPYVAAELRRLHALNGELLEALKQMLEVWEEDPAYGATHADKARAVIARVEGQA
jgi:hypothetical protein